MDKTVLLVCDIQDNFRNLIIDFGSVVHGSLFMIKACQTLGIPIIATEQKPFKPTVSELDLKSNNITCYQKSKFSMLVDSVRQTLQQLNSKTIYLVGLEAHVCVLQTTLDLLRDGYKVFLVADCISSQHMADRNVAFQRMKRAGAILTTAESAVYELMGDASHPKFKDVLQYTKQYTAFKNEKKQMFKSNL